MGKRAAIFSLCLLLFLALAAPVLAQQSALDLTKEGLRLIKAQKFAQAAGVLQQAVSQDPASHQAWMLLGLCLGAEKRFIEADDAFNRAIRLLPRNHSKTGHYYGGRGMVRVWAGRLAEGKRDLQVALRHHPNHPRYLKYLRRADQGLGAGRRAAPAPRRGAQMGSFLDANR